MLLPGLYFWFLLPETGLTGLVLIALTILCCVEALATFLGRQTYTVGPKEITRKRPAQPTTQLRWRNVSRIDRARHPAGGLIRVAIAIGRLLMEIAARTDSRFKSFAWSPRVPEYLTLRGEGRHVQIRLHRLTRPDEMLAWVEYYERIGRRGATSQSQPVAPSQQGAAGRPAAYTANLAGGATPRGGVPAGVAGAGPFDPWAEGFEGDLPADAYPTELQPSVNASRPPASPFPARSPAGRPDMPPSVAAFGVAKTSGQRTIPGCGIRIRCPRYRQGVARRISLAVRLANHSAPIRSLCPPRPRSRPHQLVAQRLYRRRPAAPLPNHPGGSPPMRPHHRRRLHGTRVPPPRPQTSTHPSITQNTPTTRPRRSIHRRTRHQMTTSRRHTRRLRSSQAPHGPHRRRLCSTDKITRRQSHQRNRGHQSAKSTMRIWRSRRSGASKRTGSRRHCRASARHPLRAMTTNGNASRAFQSTGAPSQNGLESRKSLCNACSLRERAGHLAAMSRELPKSRAGRSVEPTTPLPRRCLGSGAGWMWATATTS